jgi:tetratricopeptide (TPR) repeat protein
MNKKSILSPLIKILFNLIVFSSILLGLNQTVNANEIIKLSGDIKLKRNGINKFQPVNFLDTLNYQDELQVSPNSWVVIRCRNTDKPKLEKPGTYLVSKYCPEGKKTANVGNNIVNQQADQEASQQTIDIYSNNGTFRPSIEDLTQTPYIISPRSSSILPEQITIKWNPISEANSYQVKLGEWETKTSKTEITYVGKPLAPGYYSVSVEADSGQSSGNAGFVIIDEINAQAIQKKAEKIKQEGLDKEVEAFILARLYRNNDLNMFAIEVLEDLVRSGSQTKNVYLLLADIYDEIGLKVEAYERHEQALELEKK